MRANFRATGEIQDDGVTHVPCMDAPLRLSYAQMQYQYQERYSDTHPNMVDAEVRRLKAAKVISILEDELGSLKNRTLVDIGCSTGIMTSIYSEHFKDVVGVDIDEPAIEYAIAHNLASNIHYHLTDGMATGLPDASMDVATCTHVYEHVPDAERLLEEIYRVLRPGGVCLFIAANRLILMEPDNHLPLLSVVPKAIGDRYIRVMGKGDSYFETYRTVWALRKLVARFEIRDYTIKVTRDPERFHATDTVRPGTLKQKIAILMLRTAYWLSPTYIWVLKKRES
jgi:ubiquinone/menaquinone biosynthesis C-methylase UbiE